MNCIFFRALLLKLTSQALHCFIYKKLLPNTKKRISMVYLNKF